MTSQHPPVEDWATDFDHTDPQWVADPYPIWDELRSRCPVAHSERYGGTWLPLRHEDVAAVAYDTEHFTSRSVVVSEVRPGPEDLPAPIGLAPPITSDPPFHALARRLLLPAFSPKRIQALEPLTRELCVELLDATAGRPVVDAAVDYAEHIPLRVIVGMLGFPQEDADIFRRFIRMVLEDVDQTAEERQALVEQGELDEYMDARIAEHLADPQDDLTTFLLEAELDGRKLDPDHVRGTMVLLMIAGIDTTWSAIGAALWHLAQNPADRRRLAAEPDLMPTAVEEFLRAYAPVTMARLVAQDFDFRGRALKEGDWLLLPFPAANRDPACFPDPDRVMIDRADNRHAAFGLGIHRCIGSNLARMELRIALEEWMKRYPEFDLADPGAVTWSAGQVRGPRTVPVRVAARLDTAGPARRRRTDPGRRPPDVRQGARESEFAGVVGASLPEPLPRGGRLRGGRWRREGAHHGVRPRPWRGPPRHPPRRRAPRRAGWSDRESRCGTPVTGRRPGQPAPAWPGATSPRTLSRRSHASPSRSCTAGTGRRSR